MTRVIAVVIPAFNEARVVRETVERAVSKYPNLIVVDDGSTDSTAERLAGSGAMVLRHVVNRGQGAALQTGIRFALRSKPDVIVTFDADGQHDVDDIAAIAAPVLRGECELALGSRFLGHSANMPMRRWLMLKGAIAFTRIVSRIQVTDAHNGLRAFSPDAAQSLQIRMDRMAHASEIIDQIRIHGWSYREVPVTVRYTPYSMAKGQKTREALRIAVHVLIEKLRS